MNPGSDRSRKERLMQMVDLAQVYRDCSRAELAAMLHRDAAKIIPESGNPKLDLVFSLAEVLDWPVGDVAEALWGREPRPSEASRARPEGTFAEIDGLAIDAHRRGDYAQMQWLGECLLDMALTSLERAAAMSRIAGALANMGRFAKAIEWYQAALGVERLPRVHGQMLRVNLAASHLALWNLEEARAISTLLATELRPVDRERRPRAILAHSLQIGGSCELRRIHNGLVDSREAAGHGFALLTEAKSMYEALAAEFGDPSYAGVANTCKGLLLEAAVECGELDVHAGLGQLLAGLDGIVDPAGMRGDLLESWGWWCVSGLTLSLRHLDGDRRDRSAAIFSNKAFELADLTGSWSLRERAFALSYLAHGPSAGDEDKLMQMDTEDLRALVGTMGRFPSFRGVGWRILRRFFELRT